ncbi:MAG: histidine kinase, partial [Saprospiraceae bacterium]|nr:histidine kinase [Saprospiraceae bacterium]
GFIVYHFFTRREKSLRLKQELETQRKLAMASLESRALKAQMNPHFLFNILNNLQEMILAGETELAQTYLTKFSRLMRMILNISSREYIRIEDEIDFLKLYLELEQLRFDHQLKISIEADPDLLTEEIPVFMIQPLVENAIRHGLRPLEGRKELKIIIDQSNTFIRVRVFDNGIGFNNKNTLRVTNRENDVRALDLIRQRLEILSDTHGVDCKFSMEENHSENGMKSELILPAQIDH